MLQVLLTETQSRDCLRAARSLVKGPENPGTERYRTELRCQLDRAEQLAGRVAVLKWLADADLPLPDETRDALRAETYGPGQDVPLVGGFLVPQVRICTLPAYAWWLLVSKYEFASSVWICASPGHGRCAQVGDFDRELRCNLIGYVYWRDFFDADGLPWFSFGVGQRLLDRRFLGTMVRLARQRKAIERKGDLKAVQQSAAKLVSKQTVGQPMEGAEKYGLPIEWFRTDWDELLEQLRSQMVTGMFPDLDNGKT